MPITLIKAIREDCFEIFEMQKNAFKALLDKYQDYDTNPGAEKPERIVWRFDEEETDYYFITLENRHIGAIRIRNLGEKCELKQIFILPEYQGNGYAQETIRLVEELYPDAVLWELDTILQEKKLCHLYEKMGYKKTGKTENIKEGMDIVFYEKRK